MSAKSGAAAKVINKGPLHDQMLFLNDFIAATSTVSNLEDSMQASQDLFVETQLEPIGVETQMTQPSPSPSWRSPTQSTIDSAITPTPEYGSGKTTQRAIKRKSEVSSSASNVAQAIEQASARSASNFATLREMFQSVDQDVDFYMYLSKKTKSFSSETQEWIEDEVMKVYMEAKRRDREMAQHLNGPNYRSYDNVVYYTGISDEQMRMPSASTYNQV